MAFLLILLPAGMLFFPAPSEAKLRIGDIYIDVKNICDSSETGSVFGCSLLNSLHTVTKPYIVEDELLFSEGDDLDSENLAETERNLRALKIFSQVAITLDTVNEYLRDVSITTRDRWSTYPSLLFGTGGETMSYGGRIEEYNLLGTATYLSLEGLYRTENSIGWQGAFVFNKSRFLRSDYTLDASIVANRFRTGQELGFYQPYRTFETENSYGLTGTNVYGSDFYYANTDSVRHLNFHERRADLWFSQAWMKKDRVFASVLLELEDVNRGDHLFRHAFDNSGKILISFSSIARDYIKTTKLNSYSVEDLPVGGWGNAVLGKTFPMGPGGEGIYYVGAQGERSYYENGLYLFGQVTGGSGFRESYGSYTFQSFYGLGFWRMNPDMLIATRIRQETAWNWTALRQLILDNDAGLRGYTANKLSGDNRIVANLEYRVFPDLSLWLIKFSGVVFYDVGSVWNQDVKLSKARFHSSAGFGIRIHDTKSTGPNSIFRFDFAFNFDEKRFAGIIFTTDQLFSVFGVHQYSIPQIYGLGFDYE